ncbi:DUF4446 family protein [Pectinatus brassicae]|uniref:DUF4446 family protein n=1 Tax=Pectinatus brassicae TaxID=862415 RepID=A0A840UQD2_9FIRM|nr:DUF4446 family protein [Pectinatus brassicae]MBB5336918.1 hypothetical protein [Pectinatus brassicae]
MMIGMNGFSNLEITYAVIGMAVLLLLVYVVAIILLVKLSNMKKKYKKMMTGIESADLEKMLLEHIAKVKQIESQNRDIEIDNEAIHAILQTTIQRVGIVRFAAFEDVGGDLSYAVALLDQTNTGIILSSIFSRSSSTTYMKPIDKGNSSYKLSQEEQEALNKAMA